MKGVSKMEMETQLKLNQEILLTIKRMGINGEGIGFYKRQAVFVDGAMPPEVVIVKITELNRGHAVGELVHIRKKAFYRRKPFCQHFGVCGGCQTQHVAYDEQLRLKEEMLKQSFERYTNIDLEKVKFRPFNPFVNPRSYRFKSQMPVRNTKSGVVTGLYKKGTNELVDVLNCPVQDEDVNRVNQRILELCDEFEINAFDPKDMQGLLRYIVTRKSEATGEIQVTLVVTIYNHALKDLAKKAMDIPNVVSVGISKNHDAKNHEIFGDSYEILEGKPFITEKMGHLRYELNPKAFYQLNPKEAQIMYGYISELFDEEEETLLDLYTGSGAMALFYAKQFKKVVGIDSDRASIVSAKQNAKTNEVKHVEFIEGDAFTELKKLFDLNAKFDVAVFDPPRSGLDDKLIDLLLRHPLKKLVYVSCNPSTLAKNVKLLSRKYDVISVTPFDMFPQTSHIESVTLLVKK
jgi:23S rRNA (uracil-5-)-methyltransferase RumA